MAFCGKCGAQIDDQVKFCPACGAGVNAGSAGNASNLFDTPDNTADFDQNDIQSNKGIACLSYIGILVLIPWLAKKDSPFCRYHSNQGLILCILWFALGIVHGILSGIFMFIFFPISIIFSIIFGLGYLACLGLAIWGIVNAASGKAQELPIIGKFKILK